MATTTSIELENLNTSGFLVESHGAFEIHPQPRAPIGGGDGTAGISVKNGQAVAAALPFVGESVVATIHGRYQMSRAKASLVILLLAGVNFLNTMGSGILTVALPTIAHDVGLDDTLLLWPASVYALAAGCTLLLFGALGDVVGAKWIWVTGAALYTVFTLAVGLCHTSAQLIGFRAVLGIAIAMCLPTAVSLTTGSFLAGRWRNYAFAIQGLGQPLGFSVGLISGGSLTERLSWRWGFYISAIFNAALVLGAFWALPEPTHNKNRDLWKDLRRKIDWVGGLTISTSLGLLSYVFSVTSRDYRDLRNAYNIVLLILAVFLIPTFFLWVRRQERLGQPALIPNSLWKDLAFTSICVAVFFTWAAFNGLQYFSSLYFEKVEHQTASDTSLRFLPMVVIGIGTNVVAGYLVEKVDVHYLLSYSALIALLPPILMALVTPDWGYWKGSFIAMSLSPLHPDILFTVSNLVISKAYPGKSQSLAGGVFNAVSQVGNSIGLAIAAAISSAIVRQQQPSGVDDDDALLKGYHAAFWTCFALTIWVVPITFFGLKKGGKVGASE